MSCALIFLMGFYGLDFIADIDINSSSMGPILVVWIGPTLGVPKCPVSLYKGYSTSGTIYVETARLHIIQIVTGNWKMQTEYNIYKYNFNSPAFEKKYIV